MLQNDFSSAVVRVYSTANIDIHNQVQQSQTVEIHKWAKLMYRLYTVSFATGMKFTYSMYLRTLYIYES